MTEREKRAEVDNLITALREAGMPHPKTSGNLLSGEMLNKVLWDCRRLVKVARKADR
ncbi:MAG TPA: hypothetical protein VGC14_02545 [Rhizobium sp.]